MFGNDPFDQLVREFFGENRDLASRGSFRSNVSRDQNSIVSNFNGDYERVESGSDYFVVINVLDRLKKGDLVIELEEDFEEGGKDGWFGGGDKVLSVTNKGRKESYIKIRIPKKFAKKDMSHTLNNGILEVKFGK